MFIIFKRIHIQSWERGLLFREGEFTDVLQPGKHWFFDPLGRVRVERVSLNEPVYGLGDLEQLAGEEGRRLLGEDARILDLADTERALVWVDGRFERALTPGRHLIWTTQKQVQLQVLRLDGAGDVDARLEHHANLANLEAAVADGVLRLETVADGHVGLYFLNGVYMDTLGPGRHAFWNGVGQIKVWHLDTREAVLDVGGQEMMTADRVTLRLNLVLTYKVVDPARAVAEVDAFDQTLYRDAQLVLRAAVGTRDLDALLADKDALAGELVEALADRAAGYGVRVVTLGIKDIILPGEMKELMNRVIEARKAAEAAVITRREETAAMRSQANTAKLLEQNATLMRLRELEVLEKIASAGNLNVVLGEKGLAERVVNLL